MQYYIESMYENNPFELLEINHNRASKTPSISIGETNIRLEDAGQAAIVKFNESLAIKPYPLFEKSWLVKVDQNEYLLEVNNLTVTASRLKSEMSTMKYSHLHKFFGELLVVMPVTNDFVGAVAIGEELELVTNADVFWVPPEKRHSLSYIQGVCSVFELHFVLDSPDNSLLAVV